MQNIRPIDWLEFAIVSTTLALLIVRTILRHWK